MYPCACIAALAAVGINAVLWYCVLYAQIVPRPPRAPCASARGKTTPSRAASYGTMAQFDPASVTADPSRLRPRNVTCLRWQNTAGCHPDGPREDQQLPCRASIPAQSSGYCEVEVTAGNQSAPRVEQTLRKACGAGATVTCQDSAKFMNFRWHALTHEPQPPMPLAEAAGPGIVICGTADALPSVYAGLRLLRHHGCRLPVELWVEDVDRDAAEAAMERWDSVGGVTLRRIAVLSGFMAKPYALFYSHFEQVLLLDADNFAARDPTYLFRTPQFRATGALFWPDYWHEANTAFGLTRESLLWPLLDVPFVNMFEQESGQLLVDRRRCAAALRALLYFAANAAWLRELSGRSLYGDKDLYRFAWMTARAPFHMIARPAGVAGARLGGGFFCGKTVVQHDPAGAPLFLHRNNAKLGAPQHRRVWWTHVQQYTGAQPWHDHRVTSAVFYPDGVQVHCIQGHQSWQRSFSLHPVEAVQLAGLEPLLLAFHSTFSAGGTSRPAPRAH